MILLSIVTDEITPMLDELKQKMSDMGPLSLEIADLWVDQMAYNFATANWAPLAAATAAYKMEQGYPLAPLFRTQALRDAVTSAGWEMSGDKAVRMAPTYGAFHIEGTSFMPSRDFTLVEEGFEMQVGEAAMGFFFGE